MYKANRNKTLDYQNISTFSQRFGILYHTYVSSLYWWECYALLRRVAIIAVYTMLWQYPFYRSQGYILLLTVFLLIHVVNRPFTTAYDNILETLSIFCLCLIAVLQAGYVALDYPTITQILVSICVFSMLLIFSVAIIILLCFPLVFQQLKKDAPRQMAPTVDTKASHPKLTHRKTVIMRKQDLEALPAELVSHTIDEVKTNSGIELTTVDEADFTFQSNPAYGMQTPESPRSTISESPRNRIVEEVPVDNGSTMVPPSPSGIQVAQQPQPLPLLEEEPTLHVIHDPL